MPLKTEICPHDKCTGCAACANICSHKCVSLQNDRYGELHPIIDQSKCISCGLCQAVCPNNAKPEFYYPKTCYASWITDKQKRALCASGGIGTAIAEYVIVHKKGIVVGTAYDDQLIPRTICIDSIEGVESLKGSKYVQSIIADDLFRRIQDYLKQDRFVAYIGTPCQIAGLKAYLRNDYDNLITVDLICHGVCPTTYFSSEINTIIRKKKLEGINNVRFRGNDGYSYRLTLWDKILHPQNRTNFCLSLWHKLTGGGAMLRFSANADKNRYFKGFLEGITLRESCYSCNYARPDRVSDITIGDFIFLGKTTPFPYDKDNVSSVTINSSKGAAFYRELSATMTELTNIERDYQERLVYKPSLVHPFPRHKLNAKFRKLYSRFGYSAALRKTLFWPMARQSIRQAGIRIVQFPYDVVTKTIRVIKYRSLSA